MYAEVARFPLHGDAFEAFIALRAIRVRGAWRSTKGCLHPIVNTFILWLYLLAVVFRLAWLTKTRVLGRANFAWRTGRAFCVAFAGLGVFLFSDVLVVPRVLRLAAIDSNEAVLKLYLCIRGIKDARFLTLARNT